MSIAWGEDKPLTNDEWERINRSADAQAERAAETERRREVRRHPVFKAIRGAAGGVVPTEDDLDQLELPAGDRHSVEKALDEIAAARESGLYQKGHLIATQYAHQITDGLTGDQRKADYLDRPEPDDRGPAELAEAVSYPW